MRFHDKVGYQLEGQLVNDVWTAPIVERTLTGEVIEATRSLDPSNKVNDDIRLQNRISVMADAFALENFANLKYVMWNGARWTVTSVTVQRPRLVLSLGGVYNGQIPED